MFSLLLSWPQIPQWHQTTFIVLLLGSLPGAQLRGHGGRWPPSQLPAPRGPGAFLGIFLPRGAGRSGGSCKGLHLTQRVPTCRFPTSIPIGIGKHVPSRGPSAACCSPCRCPPLLLPVQLCGHREAGTPLPSVLPITDRRSKREPTRAPPCQNVLCLSSGKREMLLEV